MLRRLPIVLALVVLAVMGARAGQVRAQACREIAIAFQPECFRASPTGPCNPFKNGKQLDLGPQIAIWLTSGDGQRFVDTLMVTNLTARYGIGNRPGRWDFASGPKFPYGKRQHVLPVWAHARGRVYDTLVMQDGLEGFLGFHEGVSSPDPYFCKPLNFEQIVDAVTCPTAGFPSSKGRFDSSAKSYYPPRNDLTTTTLQDCDDPPGKRPGNQCNSTSAKLFAGVNDLDAVAAATPPYGAVHVLRWQLPSGHPAGRYNVLVEVNKEFDQNQSHRYPADGTVGYSWTPLDTVTNIGQPSVVYQVGVDIGMPAVSSGVAEAAVGYGDWNGATGTLHPMDATISDAPGSGVGRLRPVQSPWHAEPRLGRVHVFTGACDGNPDAGDPCTPPPPAPAAPTGLSAAAPDAISANINFAHAAQADGSPVIGYEIRFRAGATMSETDFMDAVPINSLAPGPPGSPAQTSIIGLRQLQTYAVGVRAIGPCGTKSPIAVTTFTTLQMKFVQLEGCFIATAAHGSTLAPALSSLRWARDHVLEASAPGRAAVELYYRSSPPLADALAGDDTARAIVRRMLAPLVGVAETARYLVEAGERRQGGPFTRNPDATGAVPVTFR